MRRKAEQVGRARGARIARIGAASALLMLALSACTASDVEDKLRFGWPRGVTQQAERMRQLWTWSCVAALVVGVLVWGLIFWCCVAYRRRGNELPRQTKYNLPIEIVYTVAPFLVIAVLFFYTAVAETEVDRKTPNPDVTINVVAFKWNWQFEYPERRDRQTNDIVYTVGSTEEIPILVLPDSKRVRFVERSNDVIHSFWVPEFLFKRDVFPGVQVNQFEIKPIDSRSRGAYVGRCAELCGTYHSQMNFEVRIVSDGDYATYLDTLARLGNADPDRQAEALTAIGQPAKATKTYPFATDRVDRAPSQPPA